MPTAPEVSADLADFRVEVSERFGQVESKLAGIEKELGIIRKLGTWLLGGVFGLVAALITGAATIGWSASAVNSEVKHQGQRIDQVEKRLDAMDQKLDLIISRTTPAPKAGG
jgi:tetrahydromethanopterin S-methyltransferase subunit G